MQELYHEIETRAAMRGTTTMPMIGAVFMVSGGRVRLQNQPQMRFVSAHKHGAMLYLNLCLWITKKNAHLVINHKKYCTTHYKSQKFVILDTVSLLPFTKVTNVLMCL